MLEQPVSHSMTNGMPAANQTPPIFRIRSTGLSQEFEGAGERISSIVKSPSAASATALATGVLWTVNGPLGSGPQISSRRRSAHHSSQLRCRRQEVAHAYLEQRPAPA
jgi:hypothetical protein